MTQRLRVMTFNIHHGKGTDGRGDLDRIADVIRKVDPDIVGLNEVDQAFHGRSGYADQPQALAEKLEMHSIFAPSITGNPKDAGEQTPGFGNALLSKLPIESFRAIILSAGQQAREPRVLLEGELLSENGRLIHVYVTHLSLHLWRHRKQTREILSITSQCDNPHLIVGDWNMRTGSIPYQWVTQQYQDAWRRGATDRHMGRCLNAGAAHHNEADCNTKAARTDGNAESAQPVPSIRATRRGATFPSKRPMLRLDYIFASSHFHIERSEVATHLPSASDHLPVWCDLRLP